MGELVADVKVVYHSDADSLIFSERFFDQRSHQWCSQGMTTTAHQNAGQTLHVNNDL